MNTLRNIAKKAVAVGASAVMLATTVAAASALDLSSYPAPFVTNGMANTLIVIGAKAAAEDNLAAIDIASGLQAAAVTPVQTGGGTTTTLTGDVRQIHESSDMLEIGEQIGSVVQTLTSSDLQMLKDGTVSTSSGSSDYTQQLDLSVEPLGSGIVKLAKNTNEGDVVGTFLYFKERTNLFKYDLELTSGLDSTVDSDHHATDLEDQSLFMLGQYYSMTNVIVPSDSNVDLQLIAGDVTATMSEGDKSTFNINGKKYEVTVLFVTDSGTAKFLINGEATDSLTKGETARLSDGLEIGVREVLSQSRGNTGGTLVEFYLGANKIEITDANITSTATHATVKINDKSQSDVTADLVGSTTGGATPTDVTLSSILYTVQANSADGTNLYVAPGEGVRSKLDKPETMLNGNWDITFEGLTSPATTDVVFNPSGDHQYYLQFTNNRGNQYKVPLVYDNGGVLSYGDDTDNLTIAEKGLGAGNAFVAGTYPIALDGYFVVSSNGGASDKDDTYVLRFNNVDTGDKTITMRDVSSSQDIKNVYTGDPTAGFGSPANGTFTVGGKNFGYWFWDSGSGAYKLAVDLDGSGALTNATTPVGIVVKGGGILALDSNADPTDGLVGSLTTLGKNVDNGTVQNVTWTVNDSTGKLDVTSSPAQAAGVFFTATDSGNNDNQHAMDGYGTVYDELVDSNGPDTLQIHYPSSQVEALVYVHGGDVQAATSTTGGSVRVNPVGDISALDSEVTYDQKNMIVVGGPCVNTVAAQLLGNPADCTEGFTQGHAMLKLFSTGQNTALLVAGYAAQDTRGAGKVLRNAGDYKLSGSSADVVVSSLTDIMVK